MVLYTHRTFLSLFLMDLSLPITLLLLPRATRGLLLDDLLLVALSEFQLRPQPKSEQSLRHARHRHHHHEGTIPMSDSTFDLGTYTQVPITPIVTDVSGNVLTGTKTVYSTPDASVVTLQDQA